jgi:hypothetical protein
MAFKLFDRVKETSATTGTGSFTLAGAATGFQSFGSVLSTGDTTWYAAALGTEWEVGLGTFTSPTTLARTSILASSNGGAPVSFSAGSKSVFITAPSSALEALQTLAADLAAKEPLGKVAGIVTYTSSQTVQLSDAGKLVLMDVATANDYTIAPHSSVAIPVDGRIDLASIGAGQTTIVAGAGVTLRSEDGKLKLTGQNSAASLCQIATDDWLVVGSLSA